MTFNHSLDNTLEACSVTSEDVLSVALKIKAEIDNEPFTPFTDVEQRALLILATGVDKGLLVNTFNFIDESIFDAINTQSQLVENLIKYPPTTEQIYKVLALRQFNEMTKDM